MYFDSSDTRLGPMRKFEVKEFEKWITIHPSPSISASDILYSRPSPLRFLSRSRLLSISCHSPFSVDNLYEGMSEHINPSAMTARTRLASQQVVAPG